MRSRYPISKQSKSFNQERRNKRAIIAGLIIVCASTWLFNLARLTKIQALTIDNIEISGADADITDTLRAAANEALQGNKFWIFSRSGTISYPKADIVASVKSASPRIEDVSVKRNGLNTLVVSVSEKSPQAIVCASLPDFGASDDQCYFADADGMIFKPASSADISGSKQPLYYVPDATLGSYATSTERFKMLQSIFPNLQSDGIDVQSLLVKSGGEYELYVNNPQIASNASSSDSDLAVIYLNESGPLDVQIANLVTFWKRMTSAESSKGQAVKFDYIDVRYAPNVFYRMVK